MQDTLILGPDAAVAQVVCVILHGRGQTPEDMVASITDRIDAPGVRYVLPRAAGKSWYSARAIDPLTEETRAQLGAGLDLVADVIAAEGHADGPLVLAGFSQGACMTVEYLMKHGPVAAACFFTGCRVGAVQDKLPMRDLAGMPAYASCGDDDPWIPVDAFQTLCADLATSGARLRSDMFPGRPHEVSAVELRVLQGMLQGLAAGQPLLTEKP